MIHEIIMPKENTYLLKLPDEMIGKKVEVIAFEVSNRQFLLVNRKVCTEDQYWDAITFFKKHAIDFSKLKKWTREDLYD